VQAQRSWTQISQDTGSGDPSKATLEKGKRYLDACINELAKFLIDLSKADVDDLYE
jgi:creatinine amidohydrolase